MKKLKILLIVLFTAGFGACDILDGPAPEQSLTLEEVITNEDGLRNLLSGMFNTYQDSDLGGANFAILPDIMSGDVSWTGSFPSYQQVHQFNQDAGNGEVSQWWSNAYTGINTANLIIESVGAIDDPTFSTEDQNDILGQAYYIRGVLYFELTRMFGKRWGATADNSHPGVPVRTAPVKSEPDFEDLPRGTVADGYTRAIADFGEAANLLTSSVATSNDGFATGAAANGYLMRIAMAQQRFDDAAVIAEQILGESYSLEGNIANVYSESSAEVIARVVQSIQDNNGVNGSLSTFYASTSLGGRGDAQASPAYLAALDEIITDSQQTNLDALGHTAVDDRATVLLSGNATLKYPDGLNTADDTIVLRVAEVMLSRAEALAEDTGLNIESLNLLNEIRTRSIDVVDANGVPQDETVIEYTLADFATAEELIDAILLERRIELGFEGDRFHTLVRRGMDITSASGISSTAEGDRIVFPIPQSEIDANTAISEADQNPGY